MSRNKKWGFRVDCQHWYSFRFICRQKEGKDCSEAITRWDIIKTELGIQIERQSVTPPESDYKVKAIENKYLNNTAADNDNRKDVICMTKDLENRVLENYFFWEETKKKHKNDPAYKNIFVDITETISRRNCLHRRIYRPVRAKHEREQPITHVPEWLLTVSAKASMFDDVLTPLREAYRGGRTKQTQPIRVAGFWG